MDAIASPDTSHVVATTATGESFGMDIGPMKVGGRASSQAARLPARVDFPTPPLELTTATNRGSPSSILNTSPLENLERS